MAAQCRFYFLAPTWHNHPKLGTLQLGNIMTDLKTPGPEQPLTRGPPPPPPKLVDMPPAIGSTERTESYQTNAEFSIDRLRAGNFGIWTKFVSVLGLGVDFVHGKGSLSMLLQSSTSVLLKSTAAICWQTAYMYMKSLPHTPTPSKAHSYTFKRLETTEFHPSDAYIQECLAAPPVARFLRLSRGKKPLYIVTGIKAVSGATARTSTAASRAASIGVEADGTLLGGAPVSLGPEAEIKRRKSQGVAFDGGSDFVFAFRVQKITFSKEGDMSHKDYTKGAMLGMDELPGNSEYAHAKVAAVSILELERADLEAEGFQTEAVGAGEACGWWF